MAEIARLLADDLREWWEYNPETGEFFWKKSPFRSHVLAGDLAGSVYPNGYRYIQFQGVDFRAARLAWFFVTGEDPVAFVEHKNGNRDDNRFDNLRLATNSQNQANAFWSNNTSGIKGVSWQPSRGKWIARITINGVTKNLGRYDDIVDAALAYKKAALDAWGEFALVPSDEEIEEIAERRYQEMYGKK